MGKFAHIIGGLLMVFMMISRCSNQDKAQEVKEWIKAKHLSKSTWQPANKINANARIYKGNLWMQLNFVEIMGELREACTKQNKVYNTCILKYELIINGKPINYCYNKKILSDRLYEDSIRDFKFPECDLIKFWWVDLNVPIFKLASFKSSEMLNVKLHFWQDEFYTKEYRIGDDFTRDTLKKELINSEISFQIKMPEIYKTQFIIDSLLIRDDSVWLPERNEFVPWYSPSDKYISVIARNEYEQITDETHVEKSPDRFIKPDTLQLFHYAKNSEVELKVRGARGITGFRGYISAIEENRQLRVELEYVKPLYFTKKFMGRVN